MTYTPTTAFGALAAERMAPWLTDDLAIYLDGVGAMIDEVWTLVMDVSADGQPDFIPGYGIVFDVDLCPAKWLPYLGQIVGVPIPAGTSELDARQLIKDEANIHRGTVAAMRRAIAKTLTPFTFTANTTEGSATLTSVSSVAGVYHGATLLDGNGIPVGAIAATVGTTTITLTDQYGATLLADATATGVTISARTARIVERVDDDGYAAAFLTDPARTPDAAATLAAALTQKPGGIFPFNQYLSATPLLMEYTRALSAVTATLASATIADVT